MQDLGSEKGKKTVKIYFETHEIEMELDFIVVQIDSISLKA